jgi:hypothetical protein
MPTWRKGSWVQANMPTGVQDVWPSVAECSEKVVSMTFLARCRREARGRVGFRGAREHRVASRFQFQIEQCEAECHSVGVEVEGRVTPVTRTW